MWGSDAGFRCWILPRDIREHEQNSMTQRKLLAFRRRFQISAHSIGYQYPRFNRFRQGFLRRRQPGMEGSHARRSVGRGDLGAGSSIGAPVGKDGVPGLVEALTMSAQGL